MPFILRVDIDKPYGHHSLFTKIISKCREDYSFPALDTLNYLKPTIEFLNFCNGLNVHTFLYFRNCTVPNKEVMRLISEGDHLIGFHAENTRSMETFQQELDAFKLKVNKEVKYFTKHGSGVLKLGKYHYAPYEPEKYIVWSKQLDMDFSLGNGIASSLNDLLPEKGFYKNMFWLESDYRHEGLKNVEDLIEFAKQHIVPLVIHPANFYSRAEVKEDLTKLIELAKVNGISWLKQIDK